MTFDIEKKFRQDCRDFFVIAVHYLQSNLPYDVSLPQHAHYIHPDKRNASESLSAISNLAVKMTSVLNNNNCLYKALVWKMLRPIPLLIKFLVSGNSSKMKISKKNGISWMKMKIIHQPQGRRIRIGQELKNCVELNLLPIRWFLGEAWLPKGRKRISKISITGCPHEIRSIFKPSKFIQKGYFQ